MDETLDVVADHAWVETAEEFDRLDIQQGDEISFTAVAAHYQRGYLGPGPSRSGYGTDYTLSGLRDIKVIGRDKGLMDDEDSPDPHDGRKRGRHFTIRRITGGRAR